MSLLDFKFLKRLLSPTSNDSRIGDGDRVDTAIYKLQSQLDSVKTVAGNSGVLDRTQSTITFNDSTRVFSMTPVSGSFTLFYNAVISVYYSAQTVTIPNTTGLHFVYFDSASKTLTTTSTFTQSLITDHVLVALLYYRADIGKHIYFADERHGVIMDKATHLHLHLTYGAQYVNGLGLTNINADASGNLDSSSQFGVEAGNVRDEDLQHYISDNPFQTISTTAHIPIMYRLGADTNWFRTTATAFPLIGVSDASYANTNGLPACNYKSGSNWVLQEVSNNNYFLVHILATNDIEYPIVGIVGNQYSTVTNARSNAITEFYTLSGLPFSELVLIGTVIFQTSTAYSSTNKTRIRTDDTGAAYIDWRKKTTFNVGGTGNGSSTGGTQNTFLTFSGNTGSYSATTPTDSINIVGGSGISTSVSGNTLTISATGSSGNQRTFGFFIS